jgi:ferrous-iron efflux pump FieF
MDLSSSAGTGPERETASVDADRLKRLAATASVAVATLLIVAKAAAWLTTGSISLLSTLIDSALDLAASLLNLIAIRQAIQPPDKEHRFGHGKAEPLAGLAQAGFVCGSAGFLLVQAGERLIRPAPISNSGIGYAVMALSIALTIGLVLYQRFVVKRTGSLAISADSLHYGADLLTNMSVIVALVLSTQFGWMWADPLIAIAIGVFILRSAWQILKQSLNLLMDRELPDEDRERIRRIARSHPEVIDIHDLRSRSSGTHVFIQFHLELDGNMTLLDAHTIADQVMNQLERAFPDAEVLIHQDPHGVSERRASFR